ncbi:hypothetical protein [Azospirillum doebereinerae]|uniref:Uncharacterized protein n=1 Tax=Azospirillum doebereinerae TaxID=92933 RepID=A0A3S0X8P2_9PROT|nr:hypothetical protein [Azospirillum doebereinerae]RUQ66388.1 hypothetical protein EJ913_23010 [Azospirillum doebereinerae]
MAAVDKVKELIAEVTEKLAELGSEVGGELRERALSAVADGNAAIQEFEAGGLVADAEGAGELVEAAAELASVVAELAVVAA